MTMRKFRTAFVTSPAHDVSALGDYADNIVFLSAGFEDDEKLKDAILRNIKDYNPEKDVLIPTGRVVTCTIAAIIVAAMFPVTEVVIGIYRDKDYTFMHLIPEEWSLNATN